MATFVLRLGRLCHPGRSCQSRFDANRLTDSRVEFKSRLDMDLASIQHCLTRVVGAHGRAGFITRP